MKRAVEKSEEFRKYFDKEEIAARTVYRKEPMQSRSYKSCPEEYYKNPPWWTEK